MSPGTRIRPISSSTTPQRGPRLGGADPGDARQRHHALRPGPAPDRARSATATRKAEGELLSRGETIDVEIDEAATVPVMLDAGEVAFHHLHTPHGSGPNPFDQPRVNHVITYVAPSVRRSRGRDSAQLVRGQDRFGHFEPEPRRRADFDPAALAAHAAMAIRNAIIFRDAPLPPAPRHARGFDMMRTIKGPGLFLAQFLAPVAPYDRIERSPPGRRPRATRASGADLRSAHLRSREGGLQQDLVRRVQGPAGRARPGHHRALDPPPGPLVAVHPAYNRTIDAFTPAGRHPATRKPARPGRVDQLMKAAKASANLGLERHVTFPGSLLWPYLYLYPPRPFGLVEEGFTELAKRWRPILDRFDELGIDVAYEIHPGEDLHDGLTFEMFLDRSTATSACTILYDPSHLLLQGMDYVGFLDVYGERIRAFHVKDAEYRMNARTGYWGGYQNWPTRAGRFRSPGDGQIDFGAIFSKLSELDYAGWASVEWECCIKHPDQGATEAAELVKRHIIQVQERAFDANMQAQGIDHARNRAALGLS